MMSRIYLAARYGRREELCGYRETLRELGHEVTSRWLDTDDRNGEPESTAEHAKVDLQDINRSNILISFTEWPDCQEGPYIRGGRHVELGYAIGLKAACELLIGPDDIHIIGPRENVFHLLPEIHQHNSFAEFLTHLNGQS